MSAVFAMSATSPVYLQLRKDRGSAAKRCCDLFGVHADADEETLRWAFRRALAAKPAGPDAGADPLFQSIVAIGILKDSKQLALYARLLARERVRLQSKSRRILRAGDP